jgi:histidyl-tRNA synthetase
MKKADKSGRLYTLILGEREIQAGEGELRDMGSGKQRTVPLDSLKSHITQGNP